LAGTGARFTEANFFPETGNRKPKTGTHGLGGRKPLVKGAKIFYSGTANPVFLIQNHKGVARMFMHRFWAGLCLCLCLLLAVGPAAAQSPSAEQVQMYKKAVAALDAAEKKLAANDLAGAKAQVKEANALFAQLQNKHQWLQNNKMGEDSQNQGQKLERSGQAKLQQSETLTGQDDLATKLAQEAKRELQLAQKYFTQAEIYHLRNLQVALSFLAQ